MLVWALHKYVMSSKYSFFFIMLRFKPFIFLALCLVIWALQVLWANAAHNVTLVCHCNHDCIVAWYETWKSKYMSVYSVLALIVLHLHANGKGECIEDSFEPDMGLMICARPGALDRGCMFEIWNRICLRVGGLAKKYEDCFEKSIQAFIHCNHYQLSVVEYCFFFFFTCNTVSATVS